MTTITIRQYNTPYFPIAISWSSTHSTQGNVFENKEKAITWAKDRFGDIEIIDKTGKEN